MKARREKKLTLKQEILALLNQSAGNGNPDNIGGKDLWTFYMDSVTRERILTLCAPKGKKAKVAEAVSI